MGIASLAAGLALVAAAGDLRAHPGLATGAFACAVVGALLVGRAAKDALVGAASRAASRAAARGLLVALLSLRAVALVAGPSLSDDQFRYVHEGRAQRAGLAVPYETPPARMSPPPAPDDGTSARVNHPDVPAAYPPGTELVLFATVFIGDALGHPLIALRAALVACDVLVLLALYRRRTRAPLAFAHYGAHPLPLLEIVVGAHLDGLGVAALLAAVLSSSPALRGALIGLAAHAKPVAAVALVSVPRKAMAAALLGFSIAVMAPAIPYLLAGAPLSKGFVEYATRWRAAPFVYAALEAPLRPVFAKRAAEGRYAHAHVTSRGLLVEEAGVPVIALGRDGVAQARAVRPILLDAGFFARMLAGALLAGVLIAIARFGRASAEARVGWALAAVWLLAPTVHPWYLTWLVPFAALSSSRALLFFSGAAPLLYEPVLRSHDGGPWVESAWPRIVVLCALIAGAYLDVRARRSSSMPRTPPE